MSSPAITALEDLASLFGVLDQSGPSPKLDAAWFSDPLESIESIGERLDRLADAVAALLVPLSNPPSVGDGTWYVVHSMADTSLCVVVPTDVAAGTLGLGIFHACTVGAVSVSAHLYVPLFAFGPDGANLVVTTQACDVGLTATASSTAFTVDGTTFTTLAVDAAVVLDSNTPPTVTITFLDDGVHVGASPYASARDPSFPEVASWVDEVVVQADGWLTAQVGASSKTVGDLLVAAGFLVSRQPGTYDFDLSALTDKTPFEIGLGLFDAVLGGLSGLTTPLVALPGGGLYVEDRALAGTDHYGIRLVLAEPVVVDAAADGGPATTVTLAVGTWTSGESDADNWLGAAGAGVPPGLSLLFLTVDADHTVMFAPALELVSVGVDIAGQGGPLFVVAGNSLAGVEARAYLSGAGTGWDYGVAACLHQVGFPLGPVFDTTNSANQNSVARAMLSSHDPAQGATTTVNPGFSLMTSYVTGQSWQFQLLGLDGTPTDAVWYPVQTRFGPLDCQRVGVAVSREGAATLSVLLDGGVSFAGLAVELDDLSVAFPLTAPTDPSGYVLDLKGMAISFSGGGVQISGGLLKIDAPGMTGYDGEALIAAEGLALSALGSYVSTPTYTSLFVFAVLDAPIGGPPFLFVTGLAAGFGYDRSLKMPTQDEVATFPLVAGLVDATVFAPPDGLAGILSEMEEWVPVTQGEYWLAAGISFSSFELIQTNAVVAVEFGRDFVLAILGRASLRQPPSVPGAPVVEAWVEADLDIELVLDVGQGELDACAVLSPTSYILTKAAHLTGGFAARAWFGDNPLAGDFVVTLGGYHPAFVVPDYYPQEPRVGLDWKVSDNLELSGGVYAALTPVAMMAGAAVSLTFTEGSLKAWLAAQVDVIVEWKPFYVDAEVSVTIGVSYRLDLLFVHKTLSIEVGAAVNLYGPPVGGVAHVHCYVVSFTISFGSDGPTAPGPLTWEQFAGLLPTKKVSAQNADAAGGAVGAAGAAGAAGTELATLSITARAGLLRSATVGASTVWLVRPGTLQLVIDSALPVTSQSVNSVSTGTITAVVPRNVTWSPPLTGYTSDQQVSICRAPSGELNGGSEVSLAGWSIRPQTTRLPAAMWTTEAGGGGAPDPNTTPVTLLATTGVTLGAAPVTPGASPVFDLATVFGGLTVATGSLPWESGAPEPPPVASDASLADVAQIASDGVATARTALIAALVGLGLCAVHDDPMDALAANPAAVLTDPPMEPASTTGSLVASAP